MSEVRTLAVIGAGNMGPGSRRRWPRRASGCSSSISTRPRSIAASPASRRRSRKASRARSSRRRRSPRSSAASGRRPTGPSSRQAELVVEAVFEDLDVKRDVFARLGKVAKADAILATNTSSFYVRDLAEATPHPGARARTALLLSPGEEPAGRDHPDAPDVERARSSARRRSRTRSARPRSRCADAPGFVVNRFFVPWLNEAVRLLDEKVADIADDRGCREGRVRRRAWARSS